MCEHPKGCTSNASPNKKDIYSLCKHSTGCVCDTNPDDLDVCLCCLLPNEDGITYSMTHFATFTKENFSGVPAHAFENTMRINLVVSVLIATQGAESHYVNGFSIRQKCTASIKESP